MPFVNLNTVTVVCNLVELDGGIAESGSVMFQPTEAVFDLAGHQVITPTPIAATLDGSGNLTVTVPCSDDPDTTTYSGLPWTYTVTVRTVGLPRQTYQNVVVSVADAPTAQLAPLLVASKSYAVVPLFPSSALYPQG